MPNIKTRRKRKRKKTAAEKRAARKRRKETMIVFINGKQKRVPRPQEGMSEEEAFIRAANDPSLMIEYGYFGLLAEYEAANRIPIPFDDEQRYNEPERWFAEGKHFEDLGDYYDEIEFEYFMDQDLNTLVPKGLHTLLSETLFRAQPYGGYLLNGGEPGMVETLKGLTAEQVSQQPGKDRKPIVAHANHVLFGLELINRSVHGDEKAFEGADWNAAWKLTSVNDAAWKDLLARLEKTSQEVLDAAPTYQPWNKIMLTGCFACAAHAGYHLGAIRQMMRDLGLVPVTSKT